ncbi:MAG: metalloregulator ArsR/SmtB family transcription factor [Sphingomonas sp.]|uniref:ArsR/SmtB family transcription factor n=1 Tax=Sphingomonas sp. TaxID=28214 RepID=UPI0026091D91|nr:metalloregulator ArsR/SmtB family transcription factor [Sphingomonas sp.]MDK2766098.1 metalloregulator ArsR/SmtB family transcription factor [Sphingomonas sp.]
MQRTTSPDLIYADLAEIARALGSGPRLLLLEHIAQGERPVERLAELTGLSLANASQHLQVLRRAGFVQTRRDGKNVLYRVGSGPVIELVSALRRYLEHSRSEMRQLISDDQAGQEGSSPMSRDELLQRMEGGSVLLLDVRPSDEFRLGHLPGAMNMPLSELERQLADLPKDHEIVAYCRGPYCVLSRDALTLLHANGYRARGLEDGFPEWRAAGLEVEAG